MKRVSDEQALADLAAAIAERDEVARMIPLLPAKEKRVANETLRRLDARIERGEAACAAVEESKATLEKALIERRRLVEEEEIPMLLALKPKVAKIPGGPEAWQKAWDSTQQFLIDDEREREGILNGTIRLE